MKANRREFCGVMAAGLALATGKNGGGATAAAASTREVIFTFTGLLAAEIEETARKEMTVSLLDPTKLQVDDDHTTQLLVRLDDYVWPYQFGKDDNGPVLKEPRQHHRHPQIIRIGGEKYGMWGLKNTFLWMDDAKTLAGEVVAAAQTSFEFKKLGADVTKEPANEAGWEGREWFVTRKDICAAYERLNPGKMCPTLERIKYPYATSQFQLTRGSGAGLMPVTKCEQKRDYALGDVNAPRRKFGAEFRVVYSVAADTTDICLSPRDPMTGTLIEPGGLVIRLRTKAGAPPPVSIMNSPVALWSHDHFLAYSVLTKLEKPVCLFAYEYCKPPEEPPNSKKHTTDARAAKHKAMMTKKPKAAFVTEPCKINTQNATNPPDGGCVPFVVEVP